VMTASDDVLRLGLTVKEIAVDAALVALRADRSPVCVRATAGTQHYGSEAIPFTVRRVVADSATATAGSTVLAFEGPTLMSRSGADAASADGDGGGGGRVDLASVEVPQGCAALTGQADWSVSTEGTSFIASLPTRG
jgi:hypothetical protein